MKNFHLAIGGLFLALVVLVFLADYLGVGLI